MSFFVYIIQSEKTKGYYIGQCENVELRLAQHNAENNSHFTFRDKPWILRVLLKCSDRTPRDEIGIFYQKTKK